MRNIMLIMSSVTLLSMGTIKPSEKNRRVGNKTSNYATARLQYWGVIKGYAGINVGIFVEMDTSIGLRYEVTCSGAIVSHIGFYYKFSNPHKVIMYDFIKHRSEEVGDGSKPQDPEVTAMGNVTVNGYNCTHLHGQNDKGTATQDYYMCDTVPGFKPFTQAFKNINANVEFMVIDQSIFHYGGLVKLIMIENDKEGTTRLDLNLASAQAGIPIRLGSFDPPSH